MVKNALTINAYENRQISASVICVSLFDAQSDFTSLFVAIITILLRRTERNEIPNAEGVKQVFSPTRPTLFHVASCCVLFYIFLCFVSFFLWILQVFFTSKSNSSFVLL